MNSIVFLTQILWYACDVLSQHIILHILHFPCCACLVLLFSEHFQTANGPKYRKSYCTPYFALNQMRFEDDDDDGKIGLFCDIHSLSLHSCGGVKCISFRFFCLVCLACVWLYFVLMYIWFEVRCTNNNFCALPSYSVRECLCIVWEWHRSKHCNCICQTQMLYNKTNLYVCNQWISLKQMITTTLLHARTKG